MRLIPHSRGGALWRFALGALIVVSFTAVTTAVAGLLQFKQIAHYFDATPPLGHAQVTIANPGNPQTILLIGSDHRAREPFSASHTDTMMLVRLDPNSSTINVLSVPRDLKVQIPEGGGLQTDKLNAAYSIGGPNLLIKILRKQVFPGLRVNHIVDVNFSGFSDLVDAIGCVYTDVDHRYYNDTALTDYSSINIQPGYQRLCGDNQSSSGALAFVRFRHTDSDIVRNARQQDFIRWAKDQYGPGSLIANRDKLLKIFGRHTQTDHDLHTVDGLINLFNLVAFSAGHTIKQVPFPAIELPCSPGGPGGVGGVPCYVTGDGGAEARAFKTFMTPTTGAQNTGGSKSVPGLGRKGGGGNPTAGLMADVADGKAQASALGNAGMPVYFPRLIANNSRYCTNDTCTIGPIANSYPRPYLIHDQGRGTHPSYRMTLVINPGLGQYYGVQGTTWQNPPILDHPTQTKMVNGKNLLLFVNGHKLTVVGWKTPLGSYWISNTLTDDLPNQQMVQIAASLMRAR